MKRSSLLFRGGGEEFFQFLAELAVLPGTILKNRMICIRMIWKKRMNSSYSSKSSKSSWAKYLARQRIVQILPLGNLCLFFCRHPSSMAEGYIPISHTFEWTSQPPRREPLAPEHFSFVCILQNKNRTFRGSPTLGINRREPNRGIRGGPGGNPAVKKIFKPSLVNFPTESVS